MSNKTAAEVIAEAEATFGREMPPHVRKAMEGLMSAIPDLDVSILAKINEKKAHQPRAATAEELKPLLFVRADGFNPGDVVGWREGLAKPSPYFPKDGRAVVTRVLSTPTNRIDDDNDHYELRNVVLGFVLPCHSAECDGDHIFELAFDGRRLKVLEAFNL